MALDKMAMQSFARGMVRAGDPTLIPLDGLYDLVNGLLGDDAVPYRRSGSAYKSNAAFGSAGLRWIWDGRLAGGRRTVFADPTTLGQLAADDVTPASPIPLAALGMATPGQSAVVDGLLFYERPDNSIIAFGGSRKAADYSTGGATFTEGSRGVVGSGTAWLANVDAGMVLTRDGGGFTPSWPAGAIESVDSNVGMTLAAPWPHTTITSAYRAERVANGPFFSGAALAGLAVVSHRLIIGLADRIAVAAIGDPWGYMEDPNAAPGTGYEDYHVFHAATLGLAVTRDQLLVFTTDGVFVVSGLANELVDPQGDPLRRIEEVDRDLILWHRSGLASYHGAAIVPAQSGCWLVDAIGQPVRISEPITDLWLQYVETPGYRPGGAAVYRNHYFLPILDSGANVVDMLVCRLTETRQGPAYAWGRLAGAGANVAALARRAASATSEPLLLGADRSAGSRVLSLPYFTPIAARKTDHDGSTHDLTVETGDIATGNMVRNFINRVRAVYSLVGTATLRASASTDSGATFTDLEGIPDGGDAPAATLGRFPWKVKKRARHIRFRLKTIGAAASAKVESLELFERHSGRY